MNGRQQARRHSPEADASVQMISFSIGTERFGVDILVVQEIIMMSTITEIPNAPDFVEGVINLRGNIIPVLDLRKRLRLRNQPRLESYKATTRILVVEIDSNITGFIVDAVAKVITVPASKIQPPPDIIVAGVQSQYISGVSHLDDHILILLDFRKILSMEEREALDHVPKLLPEESEAAEA